MTQINLKQFKKAWFSFDEIKSLREAEAEINNWEWISQAEMNLFIKNELFAKYKINV
jgi:hypothetical protein